MNSRVFARVARRALIVLSMAALLFSFASLSWGKFSEISPRGFTAPPLSSGLLGPKASHIVPMRSITRDGVSQTPALQDLTNSPADERLPAWSPDGNSFAFLSNGTDANNDSIIDTLNTPPSLYYLYTMASDGSQLLCYQLPDPTWSVQGLAWKRDGSAIFVSVYEGAQNQYAIYEVQRSYQAGGTVKATLMNPFPDLPTRTDIGTTTYPIGYLALAGYNDVVYYDEQDASGHWNIYAINIANGSHSIVCLSANQVGDKREPQLAMINNVDVLIYQANSGRNWAIYSMKPSDGSLVTQLTFPALQYNDTDPQTTTDGHIVFTSTRPTEPNDVFLNKNLWVMNAGPESPANLPWPRYWQEPTIQSNQYEVATSPVGTTPNEMLFVSDHGHTGNFDIYIGSLTDTMAPYILGPPVCRNSSGLAGKIFLAGDTITVSVHVVDKDTGVRHVWLQMKSPENAQTDELGVNHVIEADTGPAGNDIRSCLTEPVPFDPKFAGSTDDVCIKDIPTKIPIEFGPINPNTPNASASQLYIDTTLPTGHPGYYAAAGQQIDGTNLFASLDSLDNVTEGQGYPEVPPFWLEMYDDGTHGDAVAGDEVYTCRLTLPTNVSSDWYFDIITEDQCCSVTDLYNSNVFHGIRRRFDNVGGCSTKDVYGQGRILLVDDFMDGQRFLSVGIGSEQTPYSIFGALCTTPCYINSPYYFYPTGSSNSTFAPAAPSPFVQNDAQGAGYGKADVWRILCRGPVPASVLDMYLPQQESEINPITSLPATVLQNNRMVVWVAPGPYQRMMATPSTDPSLPAGTGSGSIMNTGVQQSLTNYVNNGGHLWVIGPFLAAGLSETTYNTTTSSSVPSLAFLSGVLGATFHQLYLRTGNLMEVVNDIPHQMILPGLVAVPDTQNGGAWSVGAGGGYEWDLSTIPGSRWEFHGMGDNDVIPPGSACSYFENWGIFMQSHTGTPPNVPWIQYEHQGEKGTHDHHVLPPNANPSSSLHSYYGFAGKNYFSQTTAWRDGEMAWNGIAPTADAKMAFICWDAWDPISGDPKNDVKNAHLANGKQMTVGVSKENPLTHSRVVFWSFDYAHLSSAYSGKVALDTIDWLLDGMIVGTVTHGNELGVSNAIVYAYPVDKKTATFSTAKIAGAARTDKNGRYVIYGLKPGCYAVQAVANGYWYEKMPPGLLPGYAVDGGRQNEADIFMSQDDLSTAKLWGYVTTNGVPVHGATVKVTQSAGGQSYTTTTDAAGEYIFDNLASGPYVLTATHPTTKQTVTANPNPLTLSDNETLRVDLSFSTGPQAGIIQGHVTMASTSTPIPGAVVTLSQGSMTIGTPQTTDSSGYYQFANVASGQYSMQAAAPGVASVSKTVTFDSTVGSVVDFSMGSGGGGGGASTSAYNLYGRVYNGLTGNIIGGVTINVMVGTSTTPFASVISSNQLQTATDGSGAQYNFALSLPAGAYHVEAVENGYLTQAQDVTIVTGDTQTTQFLMQPLLTLPQGISLFSLPGSYTDQEPSDIFGVDPSTLTNRLATYSSATLPAAYQYYTGAGTLPINPGQAFWVIATTPLTLLKEGAPISTAQPFAIQLNTGWNLIGNPFTFIVNRGDCQILDGSATESWSTAVTSGVVSGATYTWNTAMGGYMDAAQWAPYFGYWVYAAHPCTLLVSNTPSARAIARTAPRQAASRVNWQLQLVARAGNVKDTTNYLGVAASATDGFNAQTACRKPPAPCGAFVSLAFPHTDWGMNSGDYAVDIRAPHPNQSQDWTFTVTTNQPDTDVVVSCPELMAQLPTGYRAILTDLTTQTQCYLNTSSGYTFRSGAQGATRQFTLRVGPRDASFTLNDVQATMRSDGAGANVAFTLSANANVTITIRNQTGAAIRHLITGYAATAGPNTILWNLTDDAKRQVPHGIYLCDVQATDGTGRVMRQHCIVTNLLSQ